MALLDANVLVALAWDSHIHHARTIECFATNSAEGWATCPVTESGFVRVSSNAKALPSALTASAARDVLAALRGVGAHRFLCDSVSMTDPDVPPTSGHRQVTDAHLLTLARRHGVAMVTFDAGLAGGRDVELLQA